jgi:hypothetical protein
MPSASNYSFIDRALHRLAFSAPSVQKMLGELESDFLGRRLEGVESSSEVFITGLPRAGTTLLLELLHGTGEFRSFTYRDMPFILAPVLWHRLSGSFRKRGSKAERAHGDGVEVSFDSPEAFEEVIWLTYLRERYVHAATLAPLAPGMLTGEFRNAIRATVRKLLLNPGETGTESPSLRYLSKNNANISRIDAVADLFPSSKILIVFREPAAHVQSLATQHRRFLQLHETDRFAKRYMEWIGHYEFGANCRPIDFQGWLEGETRPFRIDEAFWLRYWNAAYGFALQHRSQNVFFVDFDRLLKEPAASLDRLGGTIGLGEKSRLEAAAASLRLPTTRPVDSSSFDRDEWSRAEAVHRQLKSSAI